MLNTCVPLKDNEAIVDLFAGGGGASEGIWEALGRHPDYAINHDEPAIAVHTRNHPTTKHFCQSIWKAHPLEIVGDQAVGVLWASPDCRHFSRASGGQPKWKSVRSLPGVVLTWAKYTRPKIIVVENVPEMVSWGPLLDDGTPCPKRVGRSFKCWVGRLRGMGYHVDFKRLCAADYGVPTIRTRLFVIARLDAKPAWPQPTHHKNPSLFEEPWVPAASIIDWSIPCPSIFTRKRPLRDATLKRIADGLVKFVLNAKDPYIVDGISPHVSSFYGTSKGSSVESPLGTVTAQSLHQAVVTAHLMPITHTNSPGRGSQPQNPLPTLTCAKGGEQALVTGFLGGCGGRASQTAPRPLSVPTGTITAKADQMLVAAWVAQHNGGVIGRGLNDPVSTLTTTAAQQQIVEATLSDSDRAGAERVAAFLIHYFSNGKQGQSLNSPLGAITTKGRYALVTVHGVQRPIVDIGMRMLRRHELQGAQGFRPDYDLTDDGRLSATTAIRLIGNSVCPGMAAAVVKANVRRVPTTTTELVAA